jgi:hypothetical protein
MRFGFFGNTLVGTALLGALLVACGDSGTGTGTGGAGGTGEGGSGGAGGTGGSGGMAHATPVWVAKTDPAKGEMPEGLFVSKGTAYMGFAGLGTVKKVALSAGMVSDFGAIPPIPMNAGFLLGVVVDGAGNAYVGFGGGPGMAVKNGVYKIPAAGGSVADPFASDPNMNFPNGLLFVGPDLFVADSGGSIFKITAEGAVSTWSSDPTLSGANTPCSAGSPFPIGANGIVKIGDAFYVSNSSFAQIVKIPIHADGTAGAASVLLADCNLLGGIDGIAVDPDGTSVLAALNAQNKLVRVDAAGKVTEIHSGAPLDNPASAAIEAGSKTLYISNSSFASMAPSPGLLSLALP